MNGLGIVIETKSLVDKFGLHHVILIKELDLVWLWPTRERRPWDALLKATGRDSRKIDFAVPQAWFDEQLDKYGMDDWRSQAFWTYEVNRFGGEPLYKKTVLDEITNYLKEELRAGLADGWIELKEAESVKL
jgi:hypothetical protein